MVLCGMESVNLKIDTIKIIGINFSYNRSLENNEDDRRNIMKIEKLLKDELVKDVPSSKIAQFGKI